MPVKRAWRGAGKELFGLRGNGGTAVGIEQTRQWSYIRISGDKLMIIEIVIELWTGSKPPEGAVKASMLKPEPALAHGRRIGGGSGE
jgi:hypothetical protein